MFKEVMTKAGAAAVAAMLLVAGTATAQEPDRSRGPRRVTLEQVKQQLFADLAANPMARLGQLSIEVARQHRLGAQADYFPKFGAAFANLHYTDFLGQIVTVNRPLQGSVTQVPVPLFSQNQTIAALTFVQPITPLFQVHQLVNIARADERIAMAKAGVAITRNTREAEIEEAYFKLLILQLRPASPDLKLRSAGDRALFASTSIESIPAPGRDPEWRELAASLNHVMGWPEDTELELVPPDPLIENVTLTDVADQPGANLDVFEAEQTVVKARAAATLSKLEYMPTVAAVSGYLFQNAIPLVPSNFGYGGVIASYNLFDFGKRQRAVKEARAQLGMAEIGLAMTKAKIAGNLKNSYFELERARQFSQLAQRMGSSMGSLLNVSSGGDSKEAKAARANVEAEMVEADFAHRQAYARVKALMGPRD
jgi:outer membrane protein TolC